MLFGPFSSSISLEQLPFLSIRNFICCPRCHMLWWPLLFSSSFLPSGRACSLEVDLSDSVVSMPDRIRLPTRRFIYLCESPSPPGDYSRSRSPPTELLASCVYVRDRPHLLLARYCAPREDRDNDVENLSKRSSF